MEKKEPVKVKLSTVLLIIAAIVIIAMAVTIGILFKQNTQKAKEINNVSNAENQISQTEKKFSETEIKEDLEENDIDELDDKNENVTETTTSNIITDSNQNNNKTNNTINYTEITKELNENEVLYVEKIEKQNGKYVLKGLIYETPYIISLNELNDSIKKGSITLDLFGEKVEYLVRKNKNYSGGYALYSKEYKDVEHYYILKKDSKTYYIEANSEFSDVYKSKKQYRKITIDGNTACTFIDAGTESIKENAEKVFGEYKLHGCWKVSFKNGKCVSVYEVGVGL